MRKRTLLLLFISIIVLFFPLFSINASAGKAGVGVLNVAPKFSEIRVVRQESSFRVYITASDYNSWDDIYAVSVSLEDYGVQIAEFLFKQYEDETKYNKIDEFSENPEGSLLVKERCSVQRSSETETIADKCELNLIFVFNLVWFSQINIVISDREGGTATAHIDYNAEEMMRNSEIIVIPGLDEPISVGIPPYLLNLLALFMAITGTALVVKKRNRMHTERVAYENG
jgi:hypothetical protein